jgi:chromosome partitioning protein
MHEGFFMGVAVFLTSSGSLTTHANVTGCIAALMHAWYGRTVAIITVAATKGGVGKTTLAYEIAAALGAVLVDLEWDGGSATTMWGYDPSRYRRVPILDALEAGPDGSAPSPKRKPHQPALLPGHQDLGASNIPEDLVSDCLTAWADKWNESNVVVDTHPGANPLTDAAMSVADLVVVPVVLAAREMDGLERLLGDWAGYRLLLVPNKVPYSPPRRWVELLTRLAGDLPVAPPVSEHRWLGRRVRRSAITLQLNPGRDVARAAAEFNDVAAAVEKASA